VLVLQLRGWVRYEQLLTIKLYLVTKYKLVPQTRIGPLVWAEDRDRWKALVNVVMKLWVHKMGEFLD
jgi:hypothetical protein